MGTTSFVGGLGALILDLGGRWSYWGAEQG